MVNLGFSKRQDQKNQYSKSAHAAGASTRPPNPSSPRKLAHITDTRFAQQRDKRYTRCDERGELKSGNEAGAFCHKVPDTPLAGDREIAWKAGSWGATWYCTGCYTKYYFSHLPNDHSKYLAVCVMLGFTGRATKKARHGSAARC